MVFLVTLFSTTAVALIPVQAEGLGLSGINWNTIILSVIGLISATLTSFITYLMAKVRNNTRDTLANSEVTRDFAKETAVTVEKVHVAVNSERSKMQEELKKLNEQVAKLVQEKADDRLHYSEVEKDGLKQQIATSEAKLLVKPDTAAPIIMEVKTMDVNELITGAIKEKK